MDATDTLPAGPWPPVLEAGRLDDAAFAAAYARVGDRQRAWIKTGLAALYAACGGPAPLAAGREACLGHDVRLWQRETPLDFVLVACAAPFASPARLAAAVLPALCARVPEVAAVRVGGAWPKPLLTTLELCGVESAFRLSRRDFAGLGPVLAARGRTGSARGRTESARGRTESARGFGALVLLDGLAAPRELPPEVVPLCARTGGKVGVFPEDGAAFDWEALAFAQPDLTKCVHGGACPDREGFVPAAGTLAEAVDLGYAAVYAAESRREAGLVAAPLVLGPGRETLWIWPGITPGTFRRRRVAAGLFR